jgi:Tfp pilus assembly protein PilF
MNGLDRTFVSRGSITTPSPSHSDKRLDSWKEIAAFFERDERTVRRWEIERGLPVHRVPGSARGVVYAFTSELEEWLRHKQPAEETEPAPRPAVVAPAAAPNLKPDQLPRPTDSLSAPDAGQLSSDTSPKAGPVESQSYLLTWVVAAGLAIAVLIGMYSYRQTIRFAARAAGKHLAGAPNEPHVPTPEVQDLYLKGRYYWSKRTPENLNKAVDYFTQAIVKDPGYAPAFVGLADCYNLLREFSAMPAEEAFPRALAAAQKAVELDPLSAEAHNSLAFVTFYWNWDTVTAEREFKRALKLNPALVQGHHWYATFLLADERFPEAVDQIEQARKLDPSSATILADKGLILWRAGKKQEAVALLKQLAVTDPSLATTHSYLAKISLEKKEYPTYFAELKRDAELRHDRGALAVAEAGEDGYNTRGVQGMREMMLPVQEKLVAEGDGSAYELASTYAMLGNNTDALRLLQLAFDKREVQMLFVNEHDEFDVLHADPAYREILAKVRERVPQNAAQNVAQ